MNNKNTDLSREQICDLLLTEKKSGKDIDEKELYDLATKNHLSEEDIDTLFATTSPSTTFEGTNIASFLKCPGISTTNLNSSSEIGKSLAIN